MALKKRVIHEHGSAALSSSCLHVPHHMGGCWIPRHPPECPTLNGKMPGPPYSPPTWPPSHTEAARHVPHHMGICPHAHTHYLHVLYHMGRCWAPRHPPLTCPPSHTEDAVTPTPITYVFPSHTEDAGTPTSTTYVTPSRMEDAVVPTPRHLCLGSHSSKCDCQSSGCTESTWFK